MGVAPMSGTSQTRLPLGTLALFAYLQLLDVLTTLIGFSIGASEATPFVRMLIAWGPVIGTIASKIAAVVLVVICFRLGKGHLIRWVNLWYAALVVWNSAVVLWILRAT